MKQDKLFPTHTLTVDNLLMVEYLDSMQKDIYYNFENNPHWREDGAKWHGKNWQSKYDLHTQVKYKPLATEVVNISKKYLTDRSYIFNDLIITDMWANILRPGETHRPHTHSNNIVSGVFYVKANKTSGIVFIDPRPQAYVLCPDVKEQNLDNANSVNYDSYTNRMI